MISMLLRVLGPEYAGPVRRAAGLMTAAAIAEGLAYALLLPVLQALLAGSPADARPWLLAFAAAVAVFAVVRYVADLAGFRAGTTLLRGMYRRFGDHLARLPVGWYRPSRTGDLSTLAGPGILQVMGTIAHLLAPLISASVTPATIVLVMIAIDARMGLAALVAGPVVVAIRRWTVRSTEVADAERSDREREATGRVIEYVRAQSVLRSAGRTAERFDLLDDSLRGLRRAGRRSMLSALPGALGSGLTVQAVFTALLALGAHLALGGRAGVAEVLTLLVLSARCADPLMSLSELGGQLHAARSELVRLDAVLRAEPLPEPPNPARPDGADLVLDGVSFAHDGRTVIEDVSLSLPHGHRLALVGPSGAGKSTLLHLLARFHDVDGGSVRWGGVDVRQIGSEALVDRVSIVFQDVHLFDGSIEDNIRLGRPGAADHDVRAAVTAAGLDEVVERLPQGWSTPVGEGGVLLSGGERQRVSIARALLKDTPIVLLDEVTSALDPVTAASVQEGIERLAAGRTVVMAAHRLGTVRHVDRVAFIDGGRVVEVGTHDELLARAGRYAEFWSVAAAIPESG